MALSRVCLAVALCCLAACEARHPPIGPYKLSRGTRNAGPQQGVGEKPLIERCKERWRETRLDHFT